jgi:acyl transferase domain-containing protein
LKDTQFTQPALFVTEYALAQLELGLNHGQVATGEFVAAHISGISACKTPYT